MELVEALRLVKEENAEVGIQLSGEQGPNWRLYYSDRHGFYIDHPGDTKWDWSRLLNPNTRFSRLIEDPTVEDVIDRIVQKAKARDWEGLRAALVEFKEL